ncbi:MAG: hypothetical protein VXZ96_10870 [Myxococcota bacterium]|nr:hypothetical protein [Myxococcota bacterium]
MILSALFVINSIIAQGMLSLSAIDDQKEAVQTAIMEIEETKKSVNKQLESALKDSDPERIQCIRSAKQSIDQLQLIVVEANKKFQSNIATSNFDRSGINFRQIIVSQSAVRQLAAQAETGLGEEASSEQTSQVQVDVSALSQVPQTTDDQPSLLNLESETVSPPPDSSTFQ